MKVKECMKKSTAVIMAAAMVAGIPMAGMKAEASDDKPFDGVTLKWALTDNAASGEETKAMVELIKEKTGINVVTVKVRNSYIL